MLLMIDNYDSFTYNLVQYFGELGQEVDVYRNDQVSPERIHELGPEHIVISPGLCTPSEAGISVDVINEFMDKVPILGVCLGHQSIGQALGGRIVHANRIMHGKTSDIHHRNTDVFTGLDCLQVTAWTCSEAGDVDEIMGVRHKNYPVYGVQFHPESILTTFGHDLLRNFLQIN